MFNKNNNYNVFIQWHSAQTKVTERVSVLQKKGGNYTCIIKYKLQNKNEYTIKYESKNVRQTKFKH